MRLGRCLRFSRNDRTDEDIKLLMIMWVFSYQKKKTLIKAEVDILYPVMRTLTYSFTNSNPLAETLTGELSEVTRVLYCQDSIFIIVKNDYSKAVESTLLSYVRS